jgi:hypothetical protein
MAISTYFHLKAVISFEVNFHYFMKNIFKNMYYVQFFHFEKNSLEPSFF